MPTRQLLIRPSTTSGPEPRARVVDLLALGFERYLRAAVDFDATSRMYADVESPAAPKVPRC